MPHVSPSTTEERAVSLLALLLEKPARERSSLLDALCGGDVVLRRDLEGRLAAALPRVPSPDDEMVTRIDESTAFPESTGAESPGESIGQMLGRYKLLEILGEGGCGVVYVAEQTEPVHRRVALKVIKLGMDTRQVVARFEAERQALAMMDHPNIARILDAGVTQRGRPFFVMELVRGVRITDYCDRTRLGPHDRLNLFIKVCHAIQHAHQKGIIHRDIKPSNVLVAMHDGVPVPKVIDFGIAKATEGRLTGATVYTQLHQFMGTPAYMSPEQADLTELDIDTRSDIYSLGVLLYELLTGSTPFDADRLMASGIDAMRRTLRDEEPVRPSTKLSRTLASPPPVPTSNPDSSTEAASRLRFQRRETIDLLKGDLDWIVLKCLEKNRTRRYETANALAADIQRHLANEPVLARPPSTTDRLGKAIRRNRLLFSAGAVVLFSLAAGIAVSTSQAVRARRAEALSNQRLADAEAISKFLIEVFQSPAPNRDGRTITVAEALGTASRKLDTELVNQPASRSRLEATLGETYYALGLNQEAIPLLERARDHHRTTFGPEHPETLMVLNKLANAWAVAGRAGDTLALREEVLALRRRILGPEHSDTLISESNLAVSYQESGRWPEALAMEEEIVAIRRRINVPGDPERLAAIGNLAVSYVETGRPLEALRLREELLATARKALGPEHPDTLGVMEGVADSLHQLGRREEALPMRKQVFDASRRMLGAEHPATFAAMDNLAESLHEAGRHSEALELRRTCLEGVRRVLGPENPETVQAMTSLSISLRLNRLTEEALKLGENAVAIAHRKLDESNTISLDASMELANTRRVAGRTDEAIRLAGEVLRLKRQHLSPGHPATTKSLEGLAACYEAAGQAAEAAPLRREIAELKARARLPAPAPPPVPTPTPTPARAR